MQHHRPLSGWARYAVAAGTVCVPLVGAAWSETLRERGAYVLLLGAVAVTAWSGGRRAALAAVALAGVGALFVVIHPLGSPQVERWEELFRLCLFLGIATLISALQGWRERAESALDRTEQRLTVALEAARMGAWDAQMWTGAFWISSSMAAIFGRSVAEFATTYERFMEYIHPDDRARVSDAIARTLDGGADFEVEHRVLRPDGEVVWVNTRGRLLYDETGKAARLIGVVTDVTDRKAPRAGAVAAGRDAGGDPDLVSCDA